MYAYQVSAHETVFGWTLTLHESYDDGIRREYTQLASTVASHDDFDRWRSDRVEAVAAWLHSVAQRLLAREAQASLRAATAAFQEAQTVGDAPGEDQPSAESPA